MSVELYCKCDECGTRLTNGDGVTCDACVGELKKQIEELEKRISELESEP